MNFYKLRIINTILLFITGILVGIYIGAEKNYFKKFFVKFEDYKPIYYGKTIDKKNIDYTPIYYNKKNSPNVSETPNNDKINNYSIFEELKNISNPMEDDIEVVDSESFEAEQSSIELSDFLIDPIKFQGKQINAEKIILLRGDRKDNKLFFYFFTRFNEKDFYITVQSDDKLFKNLEEFKIGYYYNVEFKSTQGKFNEGNILVNIKPTGEKTDWASGVNAF
ncbi:MAG: hypothetical protein N2Z20_04550 [Elusimicrobiales bacterium]|nr:hypothetical protein [Elusimicrobiales bacterium]